MIINIRGTSGSGKSTLARTIMGLYKGRARLMVKGRRQPIGYILGHPAQGRSLAVIGHYETPCGGCDTIQKMEDIFNRVRDADSNGLDVLFEGLLISADSKRTLQLHEEKRDLRVIALEVSLSICLKGVNSRRWAAHLDKCAKMSLVNEELAIAGRKLKIIPEYRGEVNPKNTESKWKGVRSSMKKLQANGVNAHFHHRESALNAVRREFRI